MVLLYGLKYLLWVLVDIMIKVLWIYLLSVPTEKSSSKN